MTQKTTKPINQVILMPNIKMKAPRKTSEDSTSGVAREFDEGNLFLRKGVARVSRDRMRVLTVMSNIWQVVCLAACLPCVVWASELSIPNLPQDTPIFEKTRLDTTPQIPPSQALASLEMVDTHEVGELGQILTQMKRQNWAAARVMVEDWLTHEPNNLHALFLAGQITEQQKQPKQAAVYYRKMLAQDGSLPRPRLELAKVLWQSGDSRAAQYHFGLAQSLDLPVSVQKTVEAYLHAIRREKISLWTQLSLEPSSNINQGSKHKTITIDGKEFVLSEDNQQHSGVGIGVQSAFRYRFGEQNRWFVQSTIAVQDHKNRSNDSVQVKTMMGRNFGEPKSPHQLQASLGVQKMYYQGEDLYQGALWMADYAYQHTPSQTWSVGYEGQKLSYEPAYRYMNANQHWLSLGVGGTLAGRTHYKASVFGGVNDTKEPSYGFDRLGARFTVNHHFDYHQLSVNAKLGYQYTKYHAPAVFFGKVRQEEQYSTELGVLKRDWAWRGFSPELSIGYSQTQSNIALYDKQSTHLQLALTKNF